MIDVVFDHTSPDSVLDAEHPEFFHEDDEGRPVTTVPAWTDIIDLKHPNLDLTRYLIDTPGAVGRARGGRIPLRRRLAGAGRLLVAGARRGLADVRPGLIWLAESPHPTWVAHRRAHGLPTWSDAEMFAAFDIEYSHDLWSIWQAVVTGREPVGRYLEMLRWQDATLPANYTHSGSSRTTTSSGSCASRPPRPGRGRGPR